MEEEYSKTIKVRETTHTRLNQYGLRGETFDKIINRLLDSIEKEEDHPIPEAQPQKRRVRT